jgi:Ligand-gated ion channel.
MASALWAMWGLLCGHLVQYKAPKSWPNKFLINVWGGFSVIFVASYTANIAALIAGLFFVSGVGDQNDRSVSIRRLLFLLEGFSRVDFIIPLFLRWKCKNMRKYLRALIEETVTKVLWFRN